MTPAGLGQMVVDAVFDVIGEDGTFVVPTFSYSFTKGQDFDPAQTPSVCGMLTDYVMHNEHALRSHHPDFSVAAIGVRAEELTNNVPANAFGADSFFERFEKLDGKICNFNFDAGSTFVHYVERTINVPYRYDKKFYGTIIVDGVNKPSHSINFVHDLHAPMLVAAFEPFHERAVETGIATVTPVGRGNVCTLSAAGVRKIIESALVDAPFFLTVAYHENVTPDLTLGHALHSPDTTSMTNQMPIGVTSESYRAIEMLADRLPVTVCDIPTGTTIGDMIVPEKWELLSASVESVDGSMSKIDDDISVASHSRGFSGEISGSDLLTHIVAADSGECITKGGWAIISTNLHSKIDPTKTYKIDITVRNTFGGMRYAILPGTDQDDEVPDFVSLSQDIAALEPIIGKLISDQTSPPRSTLFCVEPFDPADIYAFHLRTSGVGV